MFLSPFIYYLLKPFVPWRLRLTLRRIHAKRVLNRCGEVWPIQESAGEPPKGWRGWPEGKQFALVLTHDVEGRRGLERVRQLAELEMELGFRSSFNFVPEGSYSVPRSLRDWLTAQGFEVGVHDLRHDGKLYRTREVFRKNAERINAYLRDWKAVGFRSGFMLRNLDWLDDLHIQYDASTFDTDPFEPQPDGVDTIFPFWVPAPDSKPGPRSSAFEPPAGRKRGYVELPYTLVQDFSLFVVLQERTTDVWKRKAAWIAERGGMALMITHPDYMCFDSVPVEVGQFAVTHYADFLRWIRHVYTDAYWHAMPKDIAAYVCKFNRLSQALRPDGDGVGRETAEGGSGRRSLDVGSRKSAPLEVAAGTESRSLIINHSTGQVFEDSVLNGLRGRRVAVVVFSHYPSDPRPRRAAEALVQLGMEVEVICLKLDEREPRRDLFNGIKITRLPLKRRRGGKCGYVLQYSSFLLASFLLLSLRSLSRRFSLVHVHNMPDVLVFSAVIPKVRGAKVILDLHDPMPELMRTIFGLKPDSAGVRGLEHLEKWSIRFADAVVTVNDACKKLFSARSCPPEKICVVMNAPDEGIFKYREPSRQGRTDCATSRPFAVMYHGSLVERHGLDIAVRALAKVKRAIPNVELRIYGESTAFLEEVLRSIRNSQLQDSVRYFGAKKLEQIVEAIQECELGIIPNRRNIFTELNTPTRIFEYLSQGKPVVAPLTPGIRHYFDPQEIIFFELGNAEDLAAKIEYVFAHPEEVERFVRRGQQVYLAHKWSSERMRFVNLVGDLLLASGHTHHETAERDMRALEFADDRSRGSFD
jgi:glycosyltransferase involved in cell wall biosynthesis